MSPDVVSDWILNGFLIWFILRLGYFLYQRRKYKISKPIIPRYSFPKNITPLEANFLLCKDISATALFGEFIFLESKGYLKIEYREHDFWVKKIKESDSTLESHQRYILRIGRFKAGRDVSFSDYLLNLGVGSEKWQNIRYKVRKGLMKKKIISKGRFLFSKKLYEFIFNSLNLNNSLVLVAVSLSVAAVGIIVAIAVEIILESSGILLNPVKWDKVLFMSGSLMGVVLTFESLFVRKLPYWTEEGKEVVKHLIGFREFVKRVELKRLIWLADKERIESEWNETPLKVKLLLAYVLALRADLSLEYKISKDIGGIEQMRITKCNI